jgi:hypothetical protein
VRLGLSSEAGFTAYCGGTKYCVGSLPFHGFLSTLHVSLVFTSPDGTFLCLRSVAAGAGVFATVVLNISLLSRRRNSSDLAFPLFTPKSRIGIHELLDVVTLNNHLQGSGFPPT